jgi:hypothetical protein
MDLFDCGRYFSFHVPAKARSNPLLKYAACAYAAKQLGRSGGVKTVRGGICSHQARMEMWPGDIEKVDWIYYAVKYYDKAIELLVAALEEQKYWVTSIGPESNDMRGDSVSSTPNESLTDNQLPKQPPRTSDELLAATAILCEFEAMDANGVWSNHLAGTKSLLDIAEVGMRPSDGAPLLHNEPKFAGDRKAIFWNFARQDFAAACRLKLS